MRVPSPSAALATEVAVCTVLLISVSGYLAALSEPVFRLHLVDVVLQNAHCDDPSIRNVLDSQ
jgi:ABC-type siderophore export system fused ATPase/permease subunit